MRTQSTTFMGTHALTREEAEPFAIRTLRALFEQYPPAEQERIRADVRRRLADELHGREFAARTEDGRTRHTSALARLAEQVYGV